LADPLAWLGSLIANSPDGVAVHQRGRLVYANATALRLVGLESAEAVGRLITSFVLLDPAAMTSDGARRLAHPGDTVEWFTAHLVRADGGWVRVDASTVGVTWAGRPATVVVVRPLERGRGGDPETALTYWGPGGLRVVRGDE